MKEFRLKLSSKDEENIDRLKENTDSKLQKICLDSL